MSTKRHRAIDATRTRPVQAGVSSAEKAAVDAYCELHECTISTVIREVIEAGNSVSGEVAERTAAYVSARLSPDEIEALTASAQLAGMEPTTWLRVAVLAYVGAGGGDALRRQLIEAAKAGQSAR